MKQGVSENDWSDHLKGKLPLVVDELLKAFHVSSFAFALAISTVIFPKDCVACGNQFIHDILVSPGMLCIAVYEMNNRPGCAIREPGLPVKG